MKNPPARWNGTRGEISPTDKRESTVPTTEIPAMPAETTDDQLLTEKEAADRKSVV